VNAAPPKKTWLRVIPSANTGSHAPSAEYRIAQPIAIAEQTPKASSVVVRNPPPIVSSSVVMGPAVKSTPGSAPVVREATSATSVKTASYVAPTKGPNVPAAVPTSPRATTGVVYLDKPVPSPASPAQPNLTVLQSWLRDRIARSCGKQAKDVEVTVQSANDVTVRVKARSEKEGQNLATKIFLTPELGPYHVSLDIPIMK
jgi:hypothetical protein